MSNFLEQLLQSTSGKRELVRSALRVQVTEELLTSMEAKNITKAELAKAIGVTRSAVTQALSGHRNLSLNKLADIADALGVQPRFTIGPNVSVNQAEVKHLPQTFGETASTAAAIDISQRLERMTQYFRVTLASTAAVTDAPGHFHPVTM